MFRVQGLGFRHLRFRVWVSKFGVLAVRVQEFGV